MKVSIIGAGAMGGSIALGLCRGSLIKPADIWVSNPTQGKLDVLKAAHPDLHITTCNKEASTEANIVILAVKPWLIDEVIDEIQLQPEQIVVSVAAGIEFFQLLEYIGCEEQTCFRLIPNTAMSLQQSTTLIASCNATPEQEQLMLDIMGEMGPAFLLPENQMAAATAMTSCGIAYALKYIQAVTQVGTEHGIPPQKGMKMVAQSLKGAAELILQGDTHPATEIDKVCTPGGLTIKGINTLDEKGFTAALIAAVKASIS